MTATLPTLRPGEMLHRTIDLGRAAVNATERSVEIAFSSEAPVERYFGTEILDHSTKSVRLGRLNNGGAVLVEHDRFRQIGVIVSARIDADRVGRAVIRFGKGPLAEEIFQDVKDGIRRLVSVGCQNHKIETESKTGGVEAVRVVDWEPFEISIVSIPADQTVGVGRVLSVPTSSIQISNSMNTQTSQIDPATAERSRVSSIVEFAENMKRSYGTEIDISAAIASGETVDVIRERTRKNVMTETFTRQSNFTPAYMGHNDGFSRQQGRDLSRYSITRALHLAGQNKLDGLELEVSQEISREMGKPTGFFLPYFALAGRAMSVTGDSGTYGGDTVANMIGPFIEALKPRLATVDLGATVLPGLSGNLSLPRQSAAATASWVSEVAALSENTPTITQVDISPHRLGAYTVLSKQLLIQSTPAIDAIIRQDLMDAIAVALDTAAINGSGSSNQPTGILQTSGIGSVVGGTNGAAPTLAHLIALVAAVANANADGNGNSNTTRPGSFLFSTKVEAKLRGTSKVSGTDSKMLLEDDQTKLVGRAWASSNVSPDTLSKGSASGICSSIVFGDFSQLVLAMFGQGIDVTTDIYTLATTGQVRIICQAFLDVAIRRAASFAAFKDCLTA